MWIKARTIGKDFRRSQKRPNAAVRPKRQAVALQTETATMAGSENDPTGITLVFAWEHRLGNKESQYRPHHQSAQVSHPSYGSLI